MKWVLKFFGLVTALLITSSAFADCTTIPAFSLLPVGKLGQISASAAPVKLMYCDGTTWKDFGGSPTATACTKNGEISLVSGELHYCNETVLWRIDSGSDTNGACTKTGEIKLNTSTSNLEFCNGTNWRVAGSDVEPESFSFNTSSNNSWEASFSSAVRRVTGITGAVATFNKTGTTCTTYTYRVCADLACSQVITLGTLVDGVTANVANGDYVRVGFVTAISPVEACTASVTIGSVTATASSTTATDDLVPSNFTWGARRSSASSTTITSGITRIAGHSGVTGSISDMGTGGSPEFRVCSDSVCTTELIGWGSASQSLSIGNHVQLRTTMGAGAYNIRRVSFSAGATTGTWYSTTGDCNTGTVGAGASLSCTCGAGHAVLGLAAVGSAGRYRQSSDVCTAAIHAGAISDGTGGAVTIQGVAAGNCPNFTGTSANGITTTTQATPGTAFFFPSLGADPCP